MKYVNAKDILPENILKQLQTYAAGTLLYVPTEGEEKSWGEVSGYRAYLLKRNRMKKAPSGTYLSSGDFFGGRVCGMWPVRRVGAHISAF